MTLNRQKIRHFDPSKTVTNLSNSMLLPNHNETFLPQKNQQQKLENTNNSHNMLSISQADERINKEKEYNQAYEKQNEEFVQKIVENHQDYFNHLKGYCACGQCICGKCRCDITPFTKLQTQPPKSSYQTQFKYNIPYENNKLDHTLTYPPGINMNKKPIDEQYQSITKSTFTTPLSSHIEIIKAPHPKLQNEELFGSTTYRHNFKKQSSELTPMLSPIGCTKVLTKIPFEGQSLYTQEYNKHYALGQDPSIYKIISKCRFPMFPSPMSPSQFPFLGSTTNRQAFQQAKFRYPSLKPAKNQLELQYPQYLWKSINATDFSIKKQIDCPGRAFISTNKIE